MNSDDRYQALLDEFHHTSLKLEFDAVLEMAAALCRSDRGRDAMLALPVLSDIGEIETCQEEILELVRLHESGESLPISDWRDSYDMLEAIKAPGSVAPGEALLAIARAEKKAREIYRFTSKRKKILPILNGLAVRFDIQDDTAEKILSTIEENFEVGDRASRLLAKIRKQSVSLRDRLRDEFNDFISRKGAGKGYEFVTVRGDRYVVSLPVKEGSRIQGIVHQTSASGASVFIEPLEFIEKNNRLESLQQEEKRETARILGELTAEVFNKKEILVGNQDTLLLFDLLAAKARFAGKFRCSKPSHGIDGTLKLRQARHPLLERRLAARNVEVTGLDIECGPDLKALVISGPNAGGKTVALKTLGLILMMDRTGLLLPCLDGSVVPDYRSIFVDIGDDQSIEMSLSTFSSKVLRMKKIVRLVDGNSLVLIDEIGDGTDPEEGGALAIALLERLMGGCGRVIVTTHMSVLKGWAHETEGAANATLEFDPENLVPLFKMRMGIPGRSWGIEMAGRLGLPRDLIEAAKKELGEKSLRLEELLVHLERTERMLGMEKEETVQRKEELSRILEKYRERLEILEEKKDETILAARKEALDIVTSTRVEMENLVREIRMTGAEKRVIRDSKKLVGDTEKALKDALRRKEKRASLRAEDAVEGAWVEIKSLGKHGRILSVDDSSKVHLELVGGLRVETRLEDLLPSREREAAEPTKKDRISWTTGVPGPMSTELMVRGMDKLEAMERVDAFIDQAVLQGLDTVWIIHGIGRGILKKAIYRMLKNDPRVRDLHPGEPVVGGDGVAVVHIK